MITLTKLEAEFFIEILEGSPEYSKWALKGLNVDELRNSLIKQVANEQ